MSNEQKEKIKKLVDREKKLRKVNHEEFDIEGILADMLFIIVEIPKWKIWEWYPIARHVDLIESEHKNCCGIELD